MCRSACLDDLYLIIFFKNREHHYITLRSAKRKPMVPENSMHLFHLKELQKIALPVGRVLLFS
jgi:hypothetical protein